jgi:hypothetical protein
MHIIKNQNTDKYFFEQAVLNTLSEQDLNTLSEQHLLDVAIQITTIHNVLENFLKKEKSLLEKEIPDSNLMLSNLKINKQKILSAFKNKYKYFDNTLLKHINLCKNLPKDEIMYSEILNVFLEWIDVHREYLETMLYDTMFFNERYRDKYDNARNLFFDLHERLQKKFVLEKIRTAYFLSNENFKNFSNYVKELFKYHPSSVVLYIDFKYKEKQVSLSQAQNDMQAFLSNRRHKPTIFKNFCGYVSKLEFSRENGFYFRNLLFFDSGEQESQLLEKVSEYWIKTITKNVGYCKTKISCKNETEQDLIKNLFFYQKDLFVNLEFLCKKDFLIKPKVNKKTKLITKGQIKKSIPKMSLDKLTPIPVISNKAGRKKSINRTEFTQLVNQKITAKEIANKMGIGKSTVYKLLKEIN